MQCYGDGRPEHALTQPTRAIEVDTVSRFGRNAQVSKERPPHDVDIRTANCAEGPHSRNCQPWGQFVKVFLQDNRVRRCRADE